MLTQPILVPVNDTQFVLLEDYTYEWTAGGKRRRVLVLKGFNTDVASVPRFCWSLTGIKPDGLQRAAAVVHDLLYQWRGLPQRPAGVVQEFDGVNWFDSAQRFSREDCDKLFRQIMSEAGETPWRITAMFWAVRLFGGSAWNN